MNQTLKNIKAIANQAASDRRHTERKRLSELQRLAEAAAPLLKAFADLEEQYVRISVLQQLWPDDYGTRRDTVSTLLVGYVAEQGLRYGLRFRVPGGQMRFSVELQANDELIFLAIKGVGDALPTTREFFNRDDWLNHFLRTMADLIDFLQ